MDRSIDGLTNGSIDRSMYCLMDQWIDDSMDQFIGGPVEGRESQRECVNEIESEDCVIIGGRSTPFEISSCAIDLVEGTQCKCECRRKR